MAQPHLVRGGESVWITSLDRWEWRLDRNLSSRNSMNQQNQVLVVVFCFLFFVFLFDFCLEIRPSLNRNDPNNSFHS